ncbi:MAG TPA: DUF2164 domain-containing protein [Petrotogaceae bacterium]|nr:DUF2164 domain-containing protein [Petrotogaceae bacterium]HPO27543.1 DUF2164 domain-containing protein [Petrotogaceae bacterium]HPX16126.1 DUF2164 domain-containing protein [Petrotogaceae bacterium]HQC41125.1 DUF2164 domain-containing protein [Petrotogaceae bacterium]HQF34336.1 DUF2164 domain-containing protein [Petrotogaceae bacterium]
MGSIEIDQQKKKVLIEKIKVFYSKEMEEEIGEFKAKKLMDFFMNELAVQIYNMAVEDAKEYMSQRIEDLLSIQKY